MKRLEHHGNKGGRQAYCKPQAHSSIRLHVQNTSSKIEGLSTSRRNSRAWNQAWGSSDRRALSADDCKASSNLGFEWGIIKWEFVREFQAELGWIDGGTHWVPGKCRGNRDLSQERLPSHWTYIIEEGTGLLAGNRLFSWERCSNDKARQVIFFFLSSIKKKA